MVLGTCRYHGKKNPMKDTSNFSHHMGKVLGMRLYFSVSKSLWFDVRRTLTSFNRNFTWPLQQALRERT